ncbi:hypothetical protein [Sinosporangium siamense]|uniref:Uncharacterized protein n=1 Tax=Sinosporangium siamense TaxID=1367973 RepID=A0A919RKS5_9ACTN|nr:hypothetical protein [Sinosporangium siamense]GII94655.1 hypothetical protein Ssi02_48860 [Sinosporangium siamense]
MIPLVFGFVVVMAFVLLLASFRSLVVALKAIVLNLLSVAAAYGVLVVVFQWGVETGDEDHPSPHMPVGDSAWNHAETKSTRAPSNRNADH